MAHIMLDLETLDVTPEAVILTLGAVKFDPYNVDEDPHTPFYIRFNVDEQTALGRTIDPSTLDWWAKQPAEVFEEAMSEEDRVGLDDATIQLNKYVANATKIWAQGPLFDIAMLESLYKMIGKPCPWSYYNVRDSRTVFDMGDDSLKKDNKTAHNALADAYAQATAVQSIYRQLRVVKK